MHEGPWPARNVKQVASWLGHADPAFTLRTYAHLMDEGLDDADFLDAAVGRVNAGVNTTMFARLGGYSRGSTPVEASRS